MTRAALIAAGLCTLATLVAAQRGQQDPRDMGGGQCANNPYNCADAPNPLTPPNKVWLEDMTWMDVRRDEGGEDDGHHPDRRHGTERAVDRARQA